MRNSGEWIDWTYPAHTSQLYGDKARAQAYRHERTLFPGVLTSLLAMAGIVYWRNRAGRVRLGTIVALTCIAVGALGARGAKGWFHPLLYQAIDAFRGIRMPTRWVMIAYVGIALLAAIGVAAIFARSSRSLRAIAATMIVAVMLFELRAAPIRWYVVPELHVPLHEWLGEVSAPGAVLELPMTQQATYEYMWRATEHHRPLLNGVSSFVPRSYVELSSAFESDPIDDGVIDHLDRVGCAFVVVHDALLGRGSRPTREWLRRAVQDGKLVFVRRFEGGGRGSYVFAVRRAVRDAERLRAPETPDPSGRTPLQNATTFLETDDRVYSAATFGNLDLGPFSTVRGPLELSGWALSPAGVAAVNVLLANGAHRIAAARHDRPDVRAAIPWYPRVSQPGFSLRIDRPPRGVSGETDLQIEIVTDSGERFLKTPVWFRWYPAPEHVPAWNEGKLRELFARLNVREDRAAERVVSGAALVDDFTAPLITDREDESDADFAERITEVFFGRPYAAITTRSTHLLQRGRSRESVVRELIASPEFRAAHVF